MSQAMSEINDDFTDDFLSFLSQQDNEAATDNAIQKHYGQERYAALAPVLNKLLQSHRLQLLTMPNGALVYKAISIELADKLKGGSLLQVNDLLLHCQ